MNNYSLLALLLMIAVSVNHSKKPYSKRQQSIWRLECELGVVTDAECPVDGGWSPWSSWSVCHGRCDDIGHRRRQRQCDNPPPSPDGLPCSGLAEQIENCHLTNCTVDDFRKLVEGDAVRIRELQQLEAVPSLMERCLETECPFEAIEAALATDNTWNLKAESLWNALLCVKHNLGCPVLGEWGAWGEWSSCGARCGGGLRWRLRRCDNPPPSDAHLVCSDTPLQARGCEGDQCATDPLDSIEEKEGIWSEWTEWSLCSVKCGTGVRRRRRTCMEISQQLLGVWGTHCKGQHNQIEVCYNMECVLDGGWSGWSAWGPCSQSCGAGRRSRMRSCTRPIPAGDGQNCVGPRTEVGSCYHMPCEIYQHTVAVLNGDSQLQFEFQNKRSRLFHFYVRFMPLSPHGTLVRRGTINSPHIRLSLQKWHVCLDASGSSHLCALPRICTTDVIEPAIWHSAMITVTSEAATLRLDDSHIALKSSFPCDPEYPNDVVNIYVGERLHGEIQELILNFIPLNIMIDRERKIRKSDFYPTHVSNVAYEKSSKEEAFLSLDNDHYLRLPCFESQDQWTLHLTVKSNRDSGTILFLRDDQSGSWFYMALQNMRLKLKLAINEIRAESCSSSDYPLDQWLDLQLSKKKESNTIEALINSEEHLHILFSEDDSTDRRKSRNLNILQNHTHFKSHPDNDSDITDKEGKHSHYSICNDEFFVGGIPNDVKSLISEDLTPFMGLIALLNIGQGLLDLRSCNMERYKEGKVQVSSRTASVSGSYHETAWGNSNSLNLTCLHTRSVRTPHSAHWLFLDVTITSALRDKKVRSVDDGRVLRLMATADNDLRGFYTCRAHSNKLTRNIVTYGVLGKIQYQLTEPDLTTFVAVITTVSLVIATLLWLFVEGIHDLRNGYGFFRDAHISPEEEADAVCKFIDDNSNLIGSHSEEMLAKARARRKAQHLTSKNSFGAQEPQGLLMEQDFSDENKDDSSASEPDGLPVLPEVVSSVAEQSQKILRCGPCYVNSPRLCSKMSSARSKLTSSSAGDSSSPRYLCSRLLLTRRFQSSRESFLMRRSKTQRGCSPNSPRKTRSNLLTIKSSTLVNLSPGQRILQKFKQLKSDDTSD